MDTGNTVFWNLLDQIVQTHNIVIDRKKGSAHPKYRNYIYPLDYGYLEGTVSSDGEGIDVWVGSATCKRVTAIISSVDIIKGDSEIKVLFSCTQEEIATIYKDHNRTDGMKGLLAVRERFT